MSGGITNAYAIHAEIRILKSYPVVVAAVDVSGHAEISNLDQQAIAHQAIAGCQISVDKVLGG